MYVGMLRIELYMPQCRTLKEKRQVVKSIIDRTRNRFNVAVAEVEATASGALPPAAWDVSPGRSTNTVRTTVAGGAVDPSGVRLWRSMYHPTATATSSPPT